MYRNGENLNLGITAIIVKPAS